MKKSTLIIAAAAVVAVLAIGGFLLANKKSDKSNSETTSSSMSPDNMENMNQENAESSQNAANSQSATSAQTSTVSIQDFAYAPAKITVKKGTKVTWTNKDSTKHDVIPDTSGSFMGSELLGQNESYSFTFDTVGTYSYHCSPHPYMKGTVEVTE